jgi:hypothetical protein
MKLCVMKGGTIVKPNSSSTNCLFSSTSRKRPGAYPSLLPLLLLVLFHPNQRTVISTEAARALCQQRSGETRFSTSAVAFSFACHSERSEEPLHLAFAVVLALVLSSTVAFLVVIPEGICFSLYSRPPATNQRVRHPIHRAFCDGWDCRPSAGHQAVVFALR